MRYQVFVFENLKKITFSGIMFMLLEVNLSNNLKPYKDLTKVHKDGILWTTTPSQKGETLVLSQFQSHPNK